MRIYYKELKGYLGALLNEQRIDEYFYNKMGKRGAQYDYFPRPTKWIHHSVCSDVFMRLLALGGKIFWIFLAPFFICLLFLRAVNFKRKYDVTTCSDRSARYVFLYSERAYQVAKLAKIDTEQCVFIKPHWVEVNMSKDDNVLNLLSIIGWWQLVIAGIKSVGAIYYIVFSSKRHQVLLQSYDVFNCFLALATLHNIEGQIYIAEHYDRWAVLSDVAIGIDSDKELAIIQHGRVIPNKGEEHVELFYKLSSVSQVFLFEENSAEYFNKHILVSRDGTAPTLFNHFSLHIELADIPKEDRPAILVVGHPVCERFHVELFSALASVPCLWFYKPHPTSVKSKNIQSVGWSFIDDPSFFPKVDLVITYPSTLFFEYRAQGIKVLEHSMDALLANEEGRSFLQKISKDLL